MEFQPPRQVMIIEAYLEGRLTLQAAAQELVSALDDTAVNVSMTPKVRTLLAEVHRLRTGEPPASSPPFTADPNRHKDGLQLLDGLQEWFWETLAKYDHPTRLDCSFHAATKQAADHIAEWLTAHQQDARVLTPVEADNDDWVVVGTSPSTAWTQELLAKWVQLLRSAPLQGVASIQGAAVLQS